ncbi:MAG: HNH endonuclease [Anaerolineales bacterium]|nr:HNH endonuclease [Anaerolineales bacterium]
MAIKKSRSLDHWLSCLEFSKVKNPELLKMLRENLEESLKQSDLEPIRDPLKLHMFQNRPIYPGSTAYKDLWFYKGNVYWLTGDHANPHRYSKEQIKLLIFEIFDKDRKKFERLKKLYSVSVDENKGIKRQRISERVRIEVWRRDNGQCVRCGSREKLEYDHIIPVSKGGSNTTRNIELLCEKCNRSKGNKIE